MLTKILAIVLCASTGLLGAVPTAIAQTASEITPDSLRPPLQRLNGSVRFTGQTGTQAPAGAEKIGITLSRVALEDALPQMATANAAFETQLTRGRIPVSELFTATADLEAAYANAGFVLARVVLPQQTLNDGGTLRVTVVNGFVETVDVSNVPEQTLRRVQGLTQTLVGRPGITREELERQLLLVGDMPGVALSSALAAGEELGGAVIAVEPDYRPITGFVGLSNPSSTALDTYSLNAGIEFNSLLQYGETLYARVSGAPTDLLSPDPVSRMFALGAVVPIGFSGLTVNIEATTADTKPLHATVPTRSDFDRQSIRLSYPFIRTRSRNVNLQASLDLQEDSQTLVGAGTIYRDKLAVLRIGASGSQIHDNTAVTNAGFVLSSGLDAFGARTAAAAAAGSVPLSRGGADATFTKLTGTLSHQRALNDQLALSLMGRFQSSFGDPLATSEQFSLTGPQALSSFDSGAVRGDAGFVVRAEVSTRRQFNTAQTPMLVRPYVFAAFGTTIIENPTAVERGSVQATSYGIGAELFVITDSNFRSTNLRIEFGRGDRNDTFVDESRISIMGNLRF
jgi:hemolysin activation/secretion protein